MDYTGCRPLTDFEVEQVLANCRGKYADRDRLLILLGIHTGFRLSVTRLWNEFVARGYRRIGVATCRHPTVILDDLEREGAVAALHARQEKRRDRIPPFLGLHGDGAAFLAWFSKYRPEAVLGFSDLHYIFLKRAGYSIPNDCAYASLQATQWKGEVAGMSNAENLMGKTVLRLMESLIQHHETGIPEHAETSLVRAVFQPGTSLPLKLKIPEKAS